MDFKRLQKNGIRWSSLVILILSVFACVYTINKPTSMYRGVVGKNSSYKYINRKLQIDDFKEIVLGTQYTTIIEKLGEPNGMVGSGLLWPYYQLMDGSCVILLFDKTLDNKREFTILKDIRIIDTLGREFFLQKE